MFYKNFNKNKRIIFISFLIIITILVVYLLKSIYETQSNTNIVKEKMFPIENNKSEELLFERDNIPEEIKEYVKNNWKDFIPYENISKNDMIKITIGEPFSIYNTKDEKYIANKFPVYNNDKCIGIADIFIDTSGKITFTVSHKGNFVDIINNIPMKKGKYRFEAKYGNGDLFIKDSDDNNKKYSNIKKTFLEIDKEKLDKLMDEIEKNRNN